MSFNIDERNQRQLAIHSSRGVDLTRKNIVSSLSLFKSKGNVVSLPPQSRGVGSSATEKRSEESERECCYLM